MGLLRHQIEENRKLIRLRQAARALRSGSQTPENVRNPKYIIPNGAKRNEESLKAGN